MQIFLVFDNYRTHQASRFINIPFNCDTRDHVAKFNLAAFVGKNRDVVWIPLHEGLDSDRKSTRLNSSHVAISYAVFCLKKKHIRSSSCAVCTSSARS